ncbi:GDSL esterase/lipase At5g45960-like [Wolffia australiana]
MWRWLLQDVIVILVFLQIIPCKARHLAEDANASITAFFTFGDSTVDSGNNNFILTTAKSNFPPYGRDFPGHQPTGRFCNGRLGVDFIAADLGVKDKVPPYLDSSLNLEELITGVCFGSAGTGFDPLTAKISAVIPIRQQLEYFKEYQARLDIAVGRKRREFIVRNAVFLVSAGSNDFILNYFGMSSRKKEFSVEEYARFIRQKELEILKELEGLGARRIAVVGLPPMGCLPFVITLNSQRKFTSRGCISYMNTVARDYNAALQQDLAVHHTLSDASVIYVDLYEATTELVKRPWDFGYEVTEKGCCGSGLLEFALMCNPSTLACPDASKYLFWDAVHPTEKTNALIARVLRPSISRLL